ncbi:MAG: hypothetical protein PHU12_02015 [Candidatus Aenigmarchaeota archaeon]|nr:hypothetical protein [Candidatus Aenigmarchaeota archaeon]
MKIITSAIFFLLIFSVATSAFVVGSREYKIVGTIAGGAGKVTGTEYNLYVSVSQPAITPSTGLLTSSGNPAKYKMCLGIFCTGLFQVPHYVTVSGNMYYDTGNVVADSIVSLAIKTGDASYRSGDYKTDSNGYFTAKVSIPEEVADRNFKIQIYVKGRVDTIYECTYDQSDNKCK